MKTEFGVLVEVWEDSKTLLDRAIIRDLREFKSWRLGRSKSSQMILPHPELALCWIEMTVSKDSRIEIRVHDEILFLDKEQILNQGPLTLHIYDLDWIETWPQAPRNPISLKATKNFKSLLSHVPSPQSALSQWRWVLSLWLGFNLFFGLWHFIFHYRENPALEALEQVVLLNALVLGPSLLMSILSQALNKKYKLREFFRIQLLGTVFWFVTRTDYLGLRWILGPLAYEEALFAVLAILISFWIFDEWLRHLFEGLKPLWRRSAIALVFSIGLASQALRYLPWKDQFYFPPDPQPPILYDAFANLKQESKEDFLNRLDKHLQNQSESSESLLKLMKSSQTNSKTTQ